MVASASFANLFEGEGKVYNITHQVKAIFVLGLDFQEEGVFKGKRERFIEEYKLLELINEYQSNFGKEWEYVRHTHIYKVVDEVGEVEYLQVVFENTMTEPSLRWMKHHICKHGYGAKKHCETKIAQKRAVIKSGDKVRVRDAAYYKGEWPLREKDAEAAGNVGTVVRGELPDGEEIWVRVQFKDCVRHWGYWINELELIE